MRICDVQRMFLIMAALCLGCLCIGSPAIGEDAKVDAKKLDGTWIIESILRDPREKNDGEGKGIRCIIAGEKVSIKLPDDDKVVGGFIIRTESAKQPNTMDLWSDESSFGK